MGVFMNVLTTIDANKSANNVISTLFNYGVFGGIIFIIMGVVSLVKVISEVIHGDQAQPGAIAKALGAFLLGITLVGLRALITAIIGVDPAQYKFF